MISRILVSGVSGPIGAALLPSLKTRGYEVTRLVRGVATDEGQISWDPAKPIAPTWFPGSTPSSISQAKALSDAGRKLRKLKIRGSRVAGTTTLAEALAGAQHKPEVFVCSSAIGYYGDRGNEVLNEQSKPGIGFLAEVCREWEAATQAAANAGIRTVQMRTGVVLSPKGGALGNDADSFQNGRRRKNWQRAAMDELDRRAGYGRRDPSHPEQRSCCKAR